MDFILDRNVYHGYQSWIILRLARINHFSMKQIKKQVEARKNNPKMDSSKNTKAGQPKKVPYEGLEQTVKGTALYKIIKPEHVWQTKGKVKRTIITHDGVKRIADFAKVSKEVYYTVLTQPDAYNNYQYTIQAKVCIQGKHDDCATEIGEANRSNLGTKGRSNPANMAEKRAYDRAVFRLLGITGILSEEELSDEDSEEDDMHGLSHNGLKEIAPLINQITLAANKSDLIAFNNMMKSSVSNYQPDQLNYLREFYKKKLADLQKTSF